VGRGGREGMSHANIGIGKGRGPKEKNAFILPNFLGKYRKRSKTWPIRLF